MKNKFSIGLIVCITLIYITGCNTLLNKNEGVLGKSTKSLDQITAQIQTTDSKIEKTSQQRLTSIGAWSKGVEVTLEKVTNPPPAVVLGGKLNEKVEELANQPDITELQQVYKIIDTFLSNEVAGQKMLDSKDKEIASLRKNIADLNADKTDSIKQMQIAAETTAAKADQYQATLKNLQGGWGLNAIWFGIKTFATRIAWSIGIFSVLFIILRLAAASNPIAGSIFSIFEQIAAWFINIIVKICPKAIAVAGHVSTGVYNEAKSVLATIVDCVETTKVQSVASNQTATIEQLLSTVELSMTPADKALIDDIKIQLGWVKPSVSSTVSPLASPTPTSGSIIK